jgi:hypothetical protein
MFINDIVSQIALCRVHLYADDFQLYISCEPQHIENCIRILNMDLDRVYRWSIENCLAINPEKSQALLINPLILLSAAIRGRLKVALNACARYIYGISKYQHITEHANKIHGCSLDV